MSKDGGSAFPFGVTSQYEKYECSTGMTMRDWFATHAPSEPWEHFEPTMPPRPQPPHHQPVGNEGEFPTEPEASMLDSWRRDPLFDIEDHLPQFSHYTQTWRDYWAARAAHDTQYKRQRCVQWPWFYADEMLKAREQ